MILYLRHRFIPRSTKCSLNFTTLEAFKTHHSVQNFLGTISLTLTLPSSHLNQESETSLIF